MYEEATKSDFFLLLLFFAVNNAAFLHNNIHLWMLACVGPFLKAGNLAGVSGLRSTLHSGIFKAFNVYVPSFC